MAKVLVDENSLSGIADAIRERSGTGDTYKPAQMADAIRGMPGQNTSVQADWNQVDPNAPDYIKNRPCGEELVSRTEPLFENAPFTGDSFPIDLSFDDFYYSILEGFKMYTVFDGASYDPSIKGEHPDAVIMFGPLTLKPSSSGSEFVGAGEGDHTLSVYGIMEETVARVIDDRYLPTRVGRVYVTSSGEETGELFNAASSAEGYYSHAEGYQTRADGYYSHAEGRTVWAHGEASHAEGYDTVTLGQHSHAEGNAAQAHGESAHAEGHTAKAIGPAAHAEGKETYAGGKYSHVEGYKTKTDLDSSHAEGYGTIAHGECSHAEGRGTIASGASSHVQGKYNIEDTRALYAHIVGNGTDNNYRSNAHTLDWRGNAWFAGGVEAQSLTLNSSVPGSTKRFILTVDDDGNIVAAEVGALLDE